MMDTPIVPASKVRVLNSPGNLHDMGKHFACSMATHTTCYFNDDDWLNPYIDAMYAKYVDQGAGRSRRITTNTMPYIAWESRRWRFDEPSTFSGLSMKLIFISVL